MPELLKRLDRCYLLPVQQSLVGVLGLQQGAAHLMKVTHMVAAEREELQQEAAGRKRAEAQEGGHLLCAAAGSARR